MNSGGMGLPGKCDDHNGRPECFCVSLISLLEYGNGRNDYYHLLNSYYGQEELHSLDSPPPNAVWRFLPCWYQPQRSQWQQSNFEATHLSDTQIREVCTRCARGGLGLELSFNSSLPSPSPFQQAGIMHLHELLRVINRLVEKGKRWQFHPPRSVASNILSRLDIVLVDALPRVFD
jgi:hypothetical protein